MGTQDTIELIYNLHIQGNPIYDMWVYDPNRSQKSFDWQLELQIEIYIHMSTMWKYNLYSAWFKFHRVQEIKPRMLHLIQ